MSASSWDVVAQVGVSVFGVIAILLVSNKNKWGFVFGLLSQPFWFVTTFLHKQWGVFALTIVYTATWGYGFYQWFFKKTANPNRD